MSCSRSLLRRHDARWGPPVTVHAVVFDWGGTLTSHHTVDLLDLWRAAASAAPRLWECAPYW